MAENVPRLTASPSNLSRRPKMGLLKTSYRFVELSLLVALCTGLALAQSNQGTLAGTVTDSSGAVVAGASVTATGAETGAVYKTTSSDTGAYSIPNMQLGAYNVSVTATGFKTVQSTGVVIQVNTTSALDIQLPPGGASENITVAGDAPTIQTESSDMGTVVTTRQILELPLALGGQGVLRAPENFIFLTPGTTGGVFQAKLAGGQNFGNEIVLDGASTARADSGSSFDQTAPSVEALQEFKVIMSTVPAQFGRTSGGVESFATKSGTNSFHGTAYDIFRNTVLDANSWFNNMDIALNPGQASLFKRPDDKKNDYGGAFGGPVWIPKIYNGRNKTFFFFSWEQYRQNQGAVTVSNLPTAAWRNGDFSSQLGAATTEINPCTGQPIIAGQIFDPATTNTTLGCRSPFPGNIIPTDRFSTVAKNLLDILPQPTFSTPTQNFVFRTSNPILTTTMTFRIDQNVSDRSKIFFSYSSRDNVNRNGSPELPDPFATGAQFQDFFTHYVRVGWDYTFSPRLLNHLNIGLNRVNSNDHSGAAVLGVDWDAQLGIKNASGPTFPQFSFDPQDNLNGYGQANFADDVINGLVVADSVSYQLGRHSLTMGLDWRAQQFSVIDHSHQSPGLGFTRDQTAAVPNNNGVTGNSFASLLLGQVQSFSLAVRSSQPRFSSYYNAAFIQDDFKVNNHLMLNLGLRYDVETPRHEAHGDTSIFFPGAANPGSTGVLGALVFAGNGSGRVGGKGNWTKTWRKDFAPRVGFAYVPDFQGGKTVFRGGYGIFYAPLTYADFGQSLTDGFTATPNGSSSDGFSSVIQLDNGIPAYPAPPNLDPAQENGTSGGGFGGISYIAPNYGRPGMVQNWSFEVQRELARDLILNVGYVGQHATHLRSSLAEINNLNPEFFTHGNMLNSSITSPDAVTLGVSSPFPEFTTLYSGGDANIAQALRPFPQYKSINTDCCLENVGQSTYNGLLAKLERRFNNGLNLLASYTWSKTLTDADSALPAFASFSGGGFVQNSYNLNGEKSVSFQDIRHTFVLSYLYELPIGPHKPFLAHGGAVGKITGGWEVGAIHRYQGGAPITFACATGVPAFDGCIRFNRVSGQPLANPVHQTGNPRDWHLFNGDPAVIGVTGTDGAFQDPNFFVSSSTAPYTFGNFPRTTAEFRTAKFLNEDISILKRTAITEGQSLVFKAEMINVFNRHVFSGPDTNPYSSTFGGVFGTADSPRQIQFILRYEF
jgi:Carboxypeptidase regulatory-like domain